MALTDPQDTLAYHASRVLCAQRDMSDVPSATVAKAVAQYAMAHTATDHGHHCPEQQALWFYGMNHGVALIAGQHAPLEPLKGWNLSFVERYHSELAPRAVRAFYYLLLICTREARHNQSIKSDHATMVAKFGKPVTDFFQSIKGGEPGIHQKLLSNPPAATIGQFTGSLVWQFYHSSWNGGYGGKAWGSIADCLHRFVTGEFSPEMMLDTIWTLSHNNGPIFNKGLFYSMYNAPVILRILDVQRSGQVPQGVLHDAQIGKYAAPELKALMADVKARFPGEIGDHVDWEVVKALGGIGSYHQEITAQQQKYGMSPAAKAAAEAAEKVKQAQIAEKKKAARAHAKSHFEVMPGQFVKKVEIDRAA
jgi:hypothetical protein